MNLHDNRNVVMTTDWTEIGLSTKHDKAETEIKINKS